MTMLLLTRLTDFLRLNGLIYLAITLLFTASSIKPTESFFEGGDRAYSAVSQLLASMWSLFALASLGLFGLFVYREFLRKLELPRLRFPVIFFCLLKLWAFSVYVIYGSMPLPVILSLIIGLAISMYLSGGYVVHGEIFYERVANGMMVFALLFCLLNAYEFTLNPEAVLWAGRLYGLTNHPNFMGGYSAMLLPFVVRGIFSNSSIIKVACVIVTLTFLFFIMATGSRSSLFSALVGLFVWGSLLFGLGRTSALVATVIMFGGGAFWGLASQAETMGLNFERLLSSENTRAEINSDLWAVYLENLLIGAPNESGATSNSYLLVLARFGTVGGALLFTIIFSALSFMMKIRQSTSFDKLSASYIAALFVIFPYSLFEGVLVENFSMGQFVFVISLTYLGSKLAAIRE